MKNELPKSGIVRRKINEHYLIYDGDNHEAVQAFVKPFDSHVTKKKNKMQIVTSRGATVVEPGEVIIKGFENRIEIFSQSEFEETYQLTG